jgi:hypothetical protein
MKAIIAIATKATAPKMESVLLRDIAFYLSFRFERSKVVSDRVGRIRIRAVQILVSAWRYAERPRRAEIFDLALEIGVVVKDLNPLVPEIRHAYVALSVHGNQIGHS